ncbi:hypothetical protein C0995_002237 [Termitomyces sp. Mi166|nr:hypothetical protein C0995_002237 [Termitomyces sp. Mi166\
MVPKISLLKISADASLLEHEHAAQEFIVAANAVFFKAQGLATLAPLYELAFGLLEGLLDNWCLLNLDSVEWRCKAEVCQACVNLWSLNKQVPWCAKLGKMVMSWEHAISTIEQIRLMHFEKMVIELEPTMPVVAPRTVMDLAPTPASATSLIQHAPSIPYIVDPSSLPISSTLPSTQEPSQQAAPHNKGKGKAKAMEDDEDKEGEAPQKLRKELEDFVVLTKFDDKLLASLLPLPSEYYEGDIGVIIALLTTWLINVGTQLANILAGTVVANPKTSKPMVLVSSMPKPIPRPIVALASPVAGPSTAPIVPSSASKPAVKGGFISKDPFMVRQFKLVGTEESSALIINQVIEVAVTQETLQDKDSSDKDNNEDSNDDEGGKGDDSNDDDAAMDVDSGKHPEET